MPTLTAPAPTGDIALVVFCQSQYKQYVIRFATEALALAWREAHPWELDGPRSDTYLVCEATEDEAPCVVPVNEIDHPTLFDLLYPTCEHGMDGRNCSGPNHWAEPGDPGWY